MLSTHLSSLPAQGLAPETWSRGGEGISYISDNIDDFFFNFIFNNIKLFRNTACGGVAPRAHPEAAPVTSHQQP